ncbi:MAG: homocysteine S-methyltransferase family protein [Candidatus Omnitrophica bacterium]|nr:homocysteine S-methyltransferase family protein [Candidatus Omnitrophota bacterium]
MNNLLERLENEILIYDGAMGTLLQERGLLLPGKAPEELNLTNPSVIEEIHRLYVAAGADIIETNTFGGLRLKLEKFGLADTFKDINFSAVSIAKKAAGRNVFVAAGIGPYEKMVQPLGSVTFEEAVSFYKEWVEVVANSGADILLFETFSDLKELKAAIIAAREVCDLPIQAQLTFEEGKRTVTGTPPEVAAVTLSALDVQIIGVNCSSGPKDLLPTARLLRKYTEKPIAVQPNAGLPRLVKGKTQFFELPETMAQFAKEFVACGVNIIGGCCGTTPDHISAIKHAVSELKPQKKPCAVRFALASRTKISEYKEHQAPLVIGERINPTGKKTLSEELRAGKMTSVRRFAIEQTKNGAHMLDVNVGTPGIDEKKMIRSVVNAVQAVSDLPIVIDSNNPDVLEEGLKEVCGKALINSVNGEEKSLEKILPLARKYGAAILGLTTDKDGLAKTVEKRLSIADNIRLHAGKYGIHEHDIVIDSLTLTISVEKEQAGFTLEAVRKIKDELHLLTSLGVSNVSFGLPHRDIINAHFLSLAVGAGLDMAILNPNNEKNMQIVRSKVKEEPTEEAVEKFIKESMELQYKEIPRPEKKKKVAANKKNVEKLLREAILYGEKDTILDLIAVALKKGIPPLDINLKILIPAIEEVGRRFEAKEYFLPQIIMAAETMQAACTRLNRELKEAEIFNKGSVVMATVEGDIHDIGKNIVCAVLESHGYKIFDLGRDVKKEMIIEEVLKKKVDIVGLSALMTTTMVEMEQVIKELNKQNRNIKVVVGGAAVTKDFAKRIGAGGYAKDAMEAVKVIEQLLKTKSA